MSICTGRSYTPSILKTPTIQEKLSSRKSTSKVRFVLPHSQNVRNILQEFLNNNNSKDYQNLICLIRDSELTDDDLSSLLNESSECISMMNNDLRLFTEVLLTIQWANRDSKLVKEYQSFLINLLAAHNYHAKVVIDNLVSLFVPSINAQKWENGEPDEEDIRKFSNIHKALKTILKIVPMCLDIFMDALIRHYPYFKKGVHINDCYLYNLLKAIEYAPSLKLEILNLIISKLITMDVAVPRDIVLKVYADVNEDVFKMDDFESVPNAVSSSDRVVVDTLDVCLNRMFNFIHAQCHDLQTNELDWNKTKDFYKDAIKIFDGMVLPTYNCHHIQFCWFILVGLKQTLVESFIDHLWKKVTDPSVFPIIRQTSVEYIASLLARASYVNLRLLKSVLQQFATWIHSYINVQDSSECVNLNLKVHAVFYSTCQALFYVTFFRHKEMIGSKKNMNFLQSLNFSKIVACRLNPLRVCQPAVVQNFSAFTRNYQLAYCQHIIEHNSRSSISTIYQNNGSLVMAQTNDVLEANYPFDPFALKRSRKYIKPHYKVYEELDLRTKEQDSEEQDTEMNDFLEQTCVASKRMKFSYGSSPGFKFNT